MMSAPALVNVDYPGAAAAAAMTPTTVDLESSVGGTSPPRPGVHAHASTGQSPPTQPDESPYALTAWAIGSTERTSAIASQSAGSVGSSSLAPPEGSGAEIGELGEAVRGADITPSGEAAMVPSHSVGGGGNSEVEQRKDPNRRLSLHVVHPGASPSPPPTLSSLSHGPGIARPPHANPQTATAPPPAMRSTKSLYQDLLFNQPSSSVETILSASCDTMGFDIAEMWLRTGPKTHQLTNSHLRPTALEDSVRNELVEVYYGERASERTHRLSPALCKRAKEACDVVWVTAHTEHGAQALRCSISDVRTAVAVPVCHEATNTNLTLIFFSIRRYIMKPAAVEFLVHMSLAAAVASVNALAEDGLIDSAERQQARANIARRNMFQEQQQYHPSGLAAGGSKQLSRSEHGINSRGHNMTPPLSGTSNHPLFIHRQGGFVPSGSSRRVSVTGAQLDLKWSQLRNVEYLTDGGNNWIHTAVFNGKPVVVKTLKPECQDLALAINEIEGELDIHSKLCHNNIVGLVGAGLTSKGVRFVVLERLDGGTLTQMLGYDTRIRDRRRRFWRKKQFSYLEVLKCARSVADAMAYCHGEAIPGSMCLHRDLKPDNIGFTLDGTVKILDFGLARIVENSSPETDEVYHMSGETGSLRYMAPEVADALPYNHKADVYSFGIIFWELNAYKKPFDGMNREIFYARVVHGGERPPINKKWPEELSRLMTSCWSSDIEERPTFSEIVAKLDELMLKEKGGGDKKKAKRGLSGLIDRHSTWF